MTRRGRSATKRTFEAPTRTRRPPRCLNRPVPARARCPGHRQCKVRRCSDAPSARTPWSRRGGENRARGPDRVAMRDGAPIDIDDVVRQAKLRRHGEGTAANASLISKRSTSPSDHCARASACRTAGTGPMPNRPGSTAPTPYATSRPSGWRPCFSAAARSATIMAAAPLLMPGALPAVMGAVAAERRLQPCKALQRGVGAVGLVLCEQRRADLPLERDADDLRIELALRLREREKLLGTRRPIDPVPRGSVHTAARELPYASPNARPRMRRRGHPSACCHAGPCRPCAAPSARRASGMARDPCFPCRRPRRNPHSPDALRPPPRRWPARRNRRRD